MVPYIKQHQREYIDSGCKPNDPGELNYKITKLCDEYLNNPNWNKNYETYNEIIGILECVKLEFYRRLVVPYEDEKCKINGDVYSV